MYMGVYTLLYTMIIFVIMFNQIINIAISFKMLLIEEIKTKTFIHD